MPKAESYLRAVSVLQGIGSLYVLLNAFVATEMSVLLAVALGVFAAAAAGASIGLGKRWKNAFRLSLALNALVVAAGVWLLFLAKDAPWLGLAHMLAGATLLFGLWLGRGGASLVP